MSELEERLTLHGRPARTLARLVDAPRTSLDERAWLRTPPRSSGEAGSVTLLGWADGNRGAIVDAPRVEHARRSWLLSVKGIGARAPLYGDSPIGFSHARELDVTSPRGERSLLGAITRESWMGEAPYGGQGLANAENALGLSIPALREALAPAMLCPVIAIVEIPPEDVLDVFYYRRHEGAIVQEHRLVPSTVRLFHQSSQALGRDVEGALAALGVRTLDALDGFLDAYLRSAMGLLTVAARSVRISEGGLLEALDYDDAWLDKDAFVASDGTLFFADLEALAYVVVPDQRALAERVKRQVERNAYEVLYAADALLRVEERWRARARDQVTRRKVLAERCALALGVDPRLRVERVSGGLDLHVQPRIGDRIVVRWLDDR